MNININKHIAQIDIVDNKSDIFKNFDSFVQYLSNIEYELDFSDIRQLNISNEFHFQMRLTDRNDEMVNGYNVFVYLHKEILNEEIVDFMLNSFIDYLKIYKRNYIIDKLLDI